MPPRCRIAPRRCCSGVLAMHRIWRPARLELIQSLTSRSAEPHCVIGCFPYRGAMKQNFVTGLLYPTRHEKITRSEEHTSELQSLMRTSYAVFCLKKKKYISIKQD